MDKYFFYSIRYNRMSEYMREKLLANTIIFEKFVQNILPPIGGYTQRNSWFAPGIAHCFHSAIDKQSVRRRPFPSTWGHSRIDS